MARSEYQINFRKANARFIDIASDTDLPARGQGQLIMKRRQEIEKLDVDKFYENRGSITLEVQKEAEEWYESLKKKKKK